MKICLFVTYHANQIYQMMSDNYKMIQVLSICFFFVYGANSQENQFNTKFKQHSENSPANKQFKTDHYNDENVTWSETALNLNAFIEPKYAQADDFDATNPVLIFNDDDANQPPILIDNSPPLLFDYDQLFNNGDSSNFQLNERDFSSFWPKIYLTPSRNENLKQSLNENDLDNDEVASNCEDYPENNVKKMAPLYSESDFDEMPLPYGQYLLEFYYF